MRLIAVLTVTYIAALFGSASAATLTADSLRDYTKQEIQARGIQENVAAQIVGTLGQYASEVESIAGEERALRLVSLKQRVDEFFMTYPEGRMRTETIEGAHLQTLDNNLHYCVTQPVYAFADTAASEEQLRLLREALLPLAPDKSSRQMLTHRLTSMFNNPHEAPFKRVLTADELAALIEKAKKEFGGRNLGRAVHLAFSTPQDIPVAGPRISAHPPDNAFTDITAEALQLHKEIHNEQHAAMMALTEAAAEAFNVDCKPSDRHTKRDVN